jgi:NADH-quinone oxidoreductase subunit C
MPTDLENNFVFKKLREFHTKDIEDSLEFRGEVTLVIRRDSLLGVCEFLRDSAELSFKFLADLTAVDHFPNEPRFEVVYHVLSLIRGERLRLKVRASGDNPTVSSVVPVWPAANAFEREVYDLFGIRFEDHPYLRRILMPEDWEGYPLRKDYPTEGFR